VPAGGSGTALWARADEPSDNASRDATHVNRKRAMGAMI
jgi:hypothetical protein